MCGIAGVVAFTDDGKQFFNNIEKANSCLRFRGPDHQGYFKDSHVSFGHSRLSIIDISASGNQPMSDETGRFTIIFNGEFFNYLEHRNVLEKKGVTFRTASDTEVLLKLYIHEGASCIEKINGFFAFAIYDHSQKTVFLARDRMGIKPLWYYHDNDKLVFASELKSLMALGIPKIPDRISILNFLQLNYVPGPWSIFENVRKMRPGHSLFINIDEQKPNLKEHQYYAIPNTSSDTPEFKGSYEAAKQQLKAELEASVKKRLIADVPLGAFLSGGIDSSVITAVASKHTSHLNTFSIGFSDEPLYDETQYAKLVADKFKTNHTVFSLTNENLFENLFSVLDYIDEPFADSSALAVHILSMHTRKHVKVALSGDGADEMFAGYNKHRAEWMIRNKKWMVHTSMVLSPLLRPFEGSRGSKFSNKLRQLHRFADGAALNNADRYWKWCGYAGEAEIDDIIDFTYENSDYFRRKKDILKTIGMGTAMNDILQMDMQLVLPNDMLVKVDMMSMANSLEVRVPFLDYKVVNFAFSLPDHFKIDATSQKKILRDAYREDLPEELFHRQKHGFEVPLLKWFRTGLRSMIEDDLLSEPFIDRQGLFNYQEIKKLKSRLFSSNPGDIEGRIWGLIVFQYWWKKYMD